MAVTLINETELRERFDISPDIGAKRLAPHIGAASRRLRSWVGADAYNDALGGSPEDELRKADLQDAEAQLAMHFALPGLNTKITPGGVVTTAREAGMGNAPVILTYLKPGEVEQLSQSYLDLAQEIARPYLLDDGTPGAPFGAVGGDQ